MYQLNAYTDIMKKQEITNRLKERKSTLEFQQKMHTGLISHNYIVVVGAYTVGSNDEGEATLMPIWGTELPSQWTPDGVKEIKEKCSFTNHLGEVMDIEAVPYKDWYSNQLKEVNDTLSTLENL